MIQTIARALLQNRGTGYIHRPLPSGTPIITAGTGVLPPSASVRSPLVQAKFQSATNACVGFSAAQAYRTAELFRGRPCPDLSGLVPYKLGRASMGFGDQDIGMSFEGMLSAVSRFGLASEATFPFSIIKVNWNIPASALHDAYDRRGMRGYRQILPGDPDAVRQAIAEGNPVIIACGIDAAFLNDEGPLIISPPDPKDVIGSHALVIEEYSADGTFGILNHYDVNWRDNGRCRFGEDYLRQAHAFVVMDVAE